MMDVFLFFNWVLLKKFIWLLEINHCLQNDERKFVFNKLAYWIPDCARRMLALQLKKFIDSDNYKEDNLWIYINIILLWYFFSKILSTLRRIWYKLYWLTNCTAKECTLVIPSLIVLRIFEISPLEGIWEEIKKRI